jgi:hypothetical protein
MCPQATLCIFINYEQGDGANSNVFGESQAARTVDQGLYVRY